MEGILMYNLIGMGIDLLPFSNNISWSSSVDTLGVELSFDSLKNIPEGEVVMLYVNGNIEFVGLIVRKSEGKFTYGYTALDFSFNLKNEVIKQFNKLSASKCIINLLGEYSIKSKIVSMPTRINKIYNGSTIADIIKDIIEQCEKDQGIKYFSEMVQDRVEIKKLIDMKISPKIIVSGDFTIDSSIEEMKNKIVITTSDGDNAKILATVEDKTNRKKFGLMQKIESIEEKEIPKAKNIANNLLKDLNKISKETTLDLLISEDSKDIMQIKANRLIYIDIPSKIKSNWYRIKSANHTLSNNHHKVSISIEL